MHEYIRIYDHRQGSGYISYNKQSEVTLQVNEYLWRSYRRIQNPLKDLS